ncbi:MULTISPECIES: fatty acid--CoA ligase family protein [unclassified Frankia]|uniref:ANL family adenylate-forming protein n=1 Tax=unclassified Frankia TaxID=2632575 RepID=UPI001EF6AD6C|nr:MULTISPECIES: fatty acid--CoA ligase family protein [unclassified Frankia]
MRNELLDRFDEWGSRPAVIEGDAVYSYRDLAGRIREAEETLRASQVRPHDPVVLNGDFSFLSIATLLALYRNRNVVIPVVNLTEASLAAITEACRPNHVATVGECLTIAPAALPTGATEEPGATTTATPSMPAATAAGYGQLAGADAAGLVLLSSGSTGVPKAILHNLDAIVAAKVGRMTRVSPRPANMLMFLLFDHIGGINSLLGVLRAAGTAVVPALRTPEEICRLVEKHRIRLLPTSPTFLNLVLIGDFHEKYDLSSLRLITYGTEPMPEDLLRRVNEAFGRARLLQTFGTSETGIATTTSDSSRSTYFRIDDPNVQYRVVDGELQIKSVTQFLGYLNYPTDSLTEDGWFRTRDLVAQSDDGSIRIEGRAQQVINVGGEKLLPHELESILITSPLVDDCVVYARANAITGQSVCVDIRPSAPTTRAELRRHVVAFLTGRVEAFKIPSRINLVDSIAVSERFKKKRSL